MSDFSNRNTYLDDEEFRKKVNEIFGSPVVQYEETELEKNAVDNAGAKKTVTEDKDDTSNNIFFARERKMSATRTDDKKDVKYKFNKHKIKRLGILLLILLVVVGIAKACSDAKSEKKEKASIADCVAYADNLAAGYFYDEAIEHIMSFSEDYAEHPELSEAIARYEEAESKLVEFTDMTQVTHIFFHSIIADPKKAFDGDSRMDGYSDYMVTLDEFNFILNQLYENDFILIDMRDMAYEEVDSEGNTKFVYGKLKLPEGKKPIVISQDDVSYYEYMTTDGFATKLIIDENGDPKCEYVDDEGNVLVGDYDMVPLMETFIKEHPDFSYRGAKGILAITGYEGVLGYRTCPTSDSYVVSDVEKAKDVAQKLKDKGWVFASHSWGHRLYGDISLESVIEDSTKWEEQVRPILGEDTNIIIFAHGDDIAGIEMYDEENEKFQHLHSLGFRYFCNVDSSKCWVQKGSNYMRMGRRNIDGYRMYYNPEMLSDLFDVESSWDQYRVFPVPAI